MSPHDATTETSVTFSLQELMKIEQERITEQEQHRRRQAELREKTEREAQQRAEQQEVERLRAEERERTLQEQRRREEAAKLEAMHHALVQAEKDRVLQQMRLQQSENERQHELKLEAVRQGGTARRLKSLLIAVSTASLLLFASTSAGWLGIVKPDQDRRLAQLTEQASSRDQENQQLKRKLDQQATQLDKLLDQVRAGHIERSTLAARLDEALKELERRGARPGASGPAAVKPPTTLQADCPPGSLDPLCGLGSHR
jgi:hypothetical protein